jgi:hypothetical protein
MVQGRSNAIPDLPRCYAARLEQEPRRRSQHGLVLRRCHGPRSHVVENEIELAWCRQGYGFAGDEQLAQYTDRSDHKLLQAAPRRITASQSR